MGGHDGDVGGRLGGLVHLQKQCFGAMLANLWGAWSVRGRLSHREATTIFEVAWSIGRAKHSIRTSQRRKWMPSK
jgi:hypothetical protein